MRSMALLLIVPLLLGLMACTSDPTRPTAQQARDDVDYSALPPASDREALSDLNRRQRGLLRRAERSCTSQVETAMSASGCIIGRTDSAVAAENDPALNAFHFALPPQHRYNPDRSADVWMNVNRFVPADTTE